jgi:hypothetical protein
MLQKSFVPTAQEQLPGEGSRGEKHVCDGFHQSGYFYSANHEGIPALIWVSHLW